jgi:hypothetical protein
MVASTRGHPVDQTASTPICRSVGLSIDLRVRVLNTCLYSDFHADLADRAEAEFR